MSAVAYELGDRSGEWQGMHFRDFHNDVGHLPRMQRCAAYDLVHYQGMHGTIPEDDRVLSWICRVSLRTWREKIAPFLADVFLPVPGGFAWMRLYERREVAAKRAAELSDKRAAAGRKGGEHRWRRPSAPQGPQREMLFALDGGANVSPAGMANASATDGKRMANATHLDSDLEKKGSEELRSSADPAGPALDEKDRVDDPIEVRPVPLARTDAASQPSEDPQSLTPRDGKSMAFAIPFHGTVNRADARSLLFSQGVSAVSQMSGRAESGARSLIGELLRDADDDAARVLDAIGRAADLRPADPAGWLRAAVLERPPAASAGPLRPHQEPLGQRAALAEYAARNGTTVEALRAAWRHDPPASQPGLVIDGAAEAEAAAPARLATGGC